MSFIDEELQLLLAHQAVDASSPPLIITPAPQGGALAGGGVDGDAAQVDGGEAGRITVEAPVALQDVAILTDGVGEVMGIGALAGGGVDGDAAQVDDDEADEIAVEAALALQDVAMLTDGVGEVLGGGALVGGGLEGGAAHLNGDEAGGVGRTEGADVMEPLLLGWEGQLIWVPAWMIPQGLPVRAVPVL
ncbi:hypothetical protein BV25DRAFT_1919287 [Artomyces pyxidatus]|uniref:Uncharacterized protein n=1 Tax=Artomyces pyxidatus TaxID=48021 RepID=A0ACB8SR06_9AGAM|nr:hypothetical protein BV25DRAFT_1919287 [Artomyces pyxidatus]